MEIIQKELNELTSSKVSKVLIESVLKNYCRNNLTPLFAQDGHDSFTQLLSREDNNLDTSIIMYAEQLARKDVEINSLRAKVY